MIGLTSSLAVGSTGPDVASLHDSIATLGFQIAPSERTNQQYGPTTQAAIKKLQGLAGVPQTGVLDGATKAVLAAALARVGVKPTDGETSYLVDGYVTDTDGNRVPNAHVVALDCELRSTRGLGVATTDASGYYAIKFTGSSLLEGHARPDLRVELVDANGKMLYSSPIVYAAGVHTTVEIPLGGEQREQPCEFVSLDTTVRPLLGSLAPHELQENNQYHDLSFLTGTTGIGTPRLALYAVASRVSTSTQLPAQLVYALLRKNIPSNAEVVALASSSSGVDLDANAQALEQALLSTSPAAIKTAVDHAIAENLLPASYAEQAPKDLATLERLATQAKLASPRGMGKTSVASVLNALQVESSIQSQFMDLYTAASGPALRTFWDDLRKNKAFTPAQADALHFGVVAGRLTRGHLPLINEMASQWKAGKIKRLSDFARLSESDWTALLKTKTSAGTTIGIPANITAATPDAAISVYTSMLVRNFTHAYPTVAFSANLGRDGKPPFAAAKQVTAYLDQNPSFDLVHTNIDTFAKKTPMQPDVRTSLLSAQRLAKLNPAYPVMSALMSKGIHSAQQVYLMGRSQFVNTYGTGSVVGATEAARIFNISEQTYGVALALATKYNMTLSNATMNAVQTPLPQNAPALIQGSPNLQTLFGSDSYCACEDCQSVLGAAAYLVDLLEFLRHRSASGGANVRDVLLKRRPDLAQIELNCANTNTALPYIDLVNELLEDGVAPPADESVAAAARQTTLSTPELNANPQYVNDAAYTKLLSAVYPWNLPFDLPLAEARTYLGQLNLSRTQLMKTFQAFSGYPSAQARWNAVETLGLTPVAADIITGGTLASGYQSWTYWGLAQNSNTIVDPYDPTKNVSGGWIDVLSQARVLLTRAALKYQELARLLNTRFINNDGTVTINCDPPGSCDVATMTMSGLTQDVLDRIHRFVRLWRATGWDVYDLDDAIYALQGSVTPGLAQLNDTLLRQLAVITTISKQYNIPVRQVVALFGTMPTRDIPTLPGDDVRYSLYHDTFENLTVLNPVDPIFALNTDATEIAAIATNPKLADHASALIAAFGISNNDLNLAVSAFTNGSLTLANLAAIYRRVSLADMLGITLSELISLLAIVESATPASPYYELVNPFDAARPEGLSVFLGIASGLGTSGLSIEQLDYVMRDVFTPGSGAAPDPLAVGSMLLTLRNGLLKIAAQTAFTSDPTGATTAKELGKLISSADVQTTMAILAGTSTMTDAAADAFIASTLGPYMNAAAAQTKLVGGAALSAGQQRYEYVLGNILTYQRNTLGTGLIVQTLAQALSLSIAVTAQLLQQWFPSATPGKHLIDDYLALPTIALTDTADPITPTTPGFSGYFSSYEALAKAAMLINSATLGTDDVAWWQSTGVAAGWLDPTTLPASPTNTAQGRFYQWNRILTATNVRAAIPGSNNTFASLFDIPRNGTTKAQYFTKIEALTQWPNDAMQVLAGASGSTADHGELSLTYPDDFLSERALAALIPAFKMLKKYGLPADVTAWIGSGVTTAAADAIKQTVKANYPYEQWLTLAKQLRDPLRMNQRDALVAYLLANPPAGVSRWLDPEDVFAHYLIDVEMCSCQETSRIVQANDSVQLFVQRCFLNLEPGVTVDATTDQDWLQWRWMSQYRVWQANREVFLFPENWIDPTLRQNISTFFSDLQSDLKKGALNADLAETALENYLEKLEQVARLDVCGTFHDTENDRERLHVIARTQGSPAVYYQRQWIDSSSWTPWEQIQLDITSDHVIPVVWNNKPYLFWAIVNVKPNQNGQPFPAAQPSSSPPSGPNLHLEVQLAWSQYKQSKWQAKQTAPQVLAFEGGFDSSSVTLKSSIRGSTLEIDVFCGTYGSGRQHAGAFILGGAGNGVEAFLRDTSALSDVGGLSVADVGQLGSSMLLPSISAPTDCWLDGDWIAPDPNNQHFLSSSRVRVGPLYTSYELYGSLQSELVLQQADNFRLITPHQIPVFDSTLPFFYRDSAREYFCVPTVYFQNGNYFTINAPAYVYHPFFKMEYRFWPFYHPFVGLIVSQLNFGGTDAMFARTLQLQPATVAGITPFDFAAYYQPTTNVLRLGDGNYPQEDIDFDPDSGYACYNWELFFHAPFLIAESLVTNRDFADAQRWYNYIFNPASATTDPVPQRYWITKPFYQMSAPDYAAQQINALMQAVNSNDPTLEHQVALWRDDPFDPDSIAQLRPVAYQRAIVMKYIDMLIAWGDDLFTQDTMETVNLATQLYVLAASLLGPRPEIVPPRVAPVSQTYAQLSAGTIDSFSNATVVAENVIPPVRVDAPTSGGTPKLPTLNTLYFSIPSNSKLLGYWDTVGDRLFKIRHCMNIQGVVQQLPLFAPPIDPGMLVAAASAGLDLGTVLSDVSAAVPPYRFTTMIRQARELCDEVRALGSALLQALERSDAEQLSTIRSGLEKQLQTAIQSVRQRQIDAATKQLDVLDKSRQAYVDRQSFYHDRDFANAWETLGLVTEGLSAIPQAVAIALETTSTVAHAVPSAQFGGSGFGGTPHVSAVYGGQNVGHASSAGAKVARIIAAVMQTGAHIMSVTGQFQQRKDEWNLQDTLAGDEIARIDTEKLAAQIRVDVATLEKAAQDVSVDEAGKVDDFLHTKFTNQDLYDWMVAQTSTTYFQAYQLAYSIAKHAERCYERELAVSDTNFIQFGYWDSLRQGLTAGDKLQYDLRRMEAEYYTANARELEIIKHVSLAQLDPYALMELRNTGKTLIGLPEMLFDLDNPGHYMRRLKSVSLTVPCVVGPYGGVSMTLSLLDNHYRTSTDTSAGYPRKSGDTRFVDDLGGTSEIVTSNAQNDDGLFELRLDDERYLPFEGSGAISNWRLTLNNVFPQFDYSTITDVVMHVRYTAREGGAAFAPTVAASVKSQLNAIALAETRKGLFRLFSARHDYGTNWARFLNPGAGNDQVLTMEMPADSFPFYTFGLDVKVIGVDVLADTADPGDYTLVITPPGGAVQTVTISADSSLNGVHHWSAPSLSPKPDLGRAPLPSGTTPPAWTIKLKKAGAGDYRSLTQADVSDLLIVVNYEVS